MSFSEQKLTEVVQVSSYESLFPACAIVKGATDDLNIAMTRGLNAKGIDLIKAVKPTATREEAANKLPMEGLQPEMGLGFSQMVTFSFLNFRQ